MTARPFDPRMNRRRELPGWVLALVAVLVVLATAAVEGATPGAMASFFHTVGMALLVVLAVIVAIVVVGAWVALLVCVALLVYAWRQMDGER